MPLLRVVAAVIADSGLVLACRRAPGKASAGRWEFPGGKVEADETDQRALVREIREELGIGIEVGDLLDRSVTGPIELSCYEAALQGGRPAGSTDHDELRWLEPGDLEQLEWAEPDLPAVRMVAGAAREEGRSAR